MPLLTPTAASSRRFDSDYYVEGYATTFDDPYVLYECDGVQYKEVIDRHALDGADLSDVIMQFDHAGRVFARTGKSNTLIVEPQERGLFMAADLSKTEQARSMHEDIAAGLITKIRSPPLEPSRPPRGAPWSRGIAWWACRARSAFWGSPEGQTAPLALLSHPFLREERGAPSAQDTLSAQDARPARAIKSGPSGPGRQERRPDYEHPDRD